jgi:hypothetical protein
MAAYVQPIKPMSALNVKTLSSTLAPHGDLSLG